MSLGPLPLPVKPNASWVGRGKRDRRQKQSSEGQEEAMADATPPAQDTHLVPGCPQDLQQTLHPHSPQALNRGAQESPLLPLRVCNLAPLSGRAKERDAWYCLRRQPRGPISQALRGIHSRRCHSRCSHPKVPSNTDSSNYGENCEWGEASLKMFRHIEESA